MLARVWAPVCVREQANFNRLARPSCRLAPSHPLSQFSRGGASWLLTVNNVIKTGAGLPIGALIGLAVATPARTASQR
jgi:hypothetical protein